MKNLTQAADTKGFLFCFSVLLYVIIIIFYIRVVLMINGQVVDEHELREWGVTIVPEHPRPTAVVFRRYNKTK